LTWRVIEADVLDGLAQLADGSVQTVVTSPPYWGLRDYGVNGQLGLEPTPEAYVERMVEVFREVRRVLRDDGTVWLNLGDSYNNRSVSRRSSHHPGLGFEHEAGLSWADMTREGRTHLSIENGDLKEKDLVGIPWMVAFALRADGWYLRSDIIWAKPNPMPESVTDRPTKAHEYVFLLSKSARYFWDADAVRETRTASHNHWLNTSARPGVDTNGGNQQHGGYEPGDITNRNLRSVWNIATESFRGAHFATFPKKLVEPCVKAGSAVGDTVLDPFAGSGTVGVVALRLGRSFVGIELSPEYAEMARNRIIDDAPLFNSPSQKEMTP
jgi:DNA modification methylase